MNNNEVILFTVYIDSLKNILIGKVTKILAWSSLTVFHKNKSSS